VCFQRVQLDFTFFYTEGNNDWVVVNDGDSETNEIIFRQSGLTQPAPTGIVSSQQYLLLRFASDANLSFRGFRATYTSLPAA
jgi:CUB domain